MPERKPSRFDLRRLLRFSLLSESAAPEPTPATESEVLFELTGQNPGNRLFGRYDNDEVRAFLERSGLLRGLARMGFPDPILSLECGDPSEQRICLYAGNATRDRLLLETRLQLMNFHLRHAIGPFPEGISFRMLVILWLVLSNPEGRFSLDHPRLPGQQRPGLGLLDETLHLLSLFSQELAVDGVLDVPEHFHTALFYSRLFRYIDPVEEGRLRAIARDLAGVPLALASEAIRNGCLVDRGTGQSLPWHPSEQVMPRRGPLRKFLHSQEYREARDRACEALRVAVDWDLYRERLAAGPP
ncbi:MAG: hypothetical protein ACM3L8_00640 [Verrucomicrobiota bacterium]